MKATFTTWVTLQKVIIIDDNDNTQTQLFYTLGKVGKKVFHKQIERVSNGAKIITVSNHSIKLDVETTETQDSFINIITDSLDDMNYPISAFIEVSND